MKKNSIVLLAGAIILAAGVALLARALLAPPAEPVTATVEAPQETAPKPPAAAIIAAATDIRPGDFIGSTHVQWIEVDGDGEIDRNVYFLRGFDRLEDLFGATVRHPVTEGQPLPLNGIVRPGAPGFLAAVLPPGKRAVSVPTGRVETSFGLVSPGDWVDVLLSLRREDSNMTDPSAPPHLAAQTLLSNVRVLALNNRVQESPSALRAGRMGDEDEDDRLDASRRAFETVTLEVSPAQAERLAVAKEVGSLQLALRSARDDGTAGTPATDSDVTTLGMTTKVYPPRPAMIQAYRGDKVEAIDLSQ